MKREAVEELVTAVVEDIVRGTDLELVDVEYVRERDWYLRVYLDKEGGIDLDDCELVSKRLSEVLDAKDPIRENYLLEVSSPGLDRALKKDKDFIRYKGRMVDIQFFSPWNGQKQLTAELGEFSDSAIEFIVDGEVHSIERNAIAQIRLHLDF